MESRAHRANVFDAAIIGGGPAGSTAGRLLAEWGYQTIILERGGDPRRARVETLPPSLKRLFRLLKIEAAGFYATTGNTAKWAESDARVEHYAEPGYQVFRPDFDRLLLSLAEQAGAIVQHESARRVDPDTATIETDRTAVHARFVIDCSGRSGVLARRFRRLEPNQRGLAISAQWRSDRWNAVDPTHTLVESYADGWAWSVPLSSETRHVTIMTASASAGVEATYNAGLAKTQWFRELLKGAERAPNPWACDASLYCATSFAGPRFLLAGDAASFVDPLSSFGVRKAMASGWLAAIAVNTCLRRPEMIATALDFYAERERRTYADHLRPMAGFFRDASSFHQSEYWERRSRVEPTEESYSPEAFTQAAGQLRECVILRLRKGPGGTPTTAPRIEGSEIVLGEAVEFIGGVNVSKLVEISGAHGQVPDLFEAYNRVCPPVALPNFLSALSVLLAKRVLTNEVTAQ
jgi:flavin-dependent dehydrogenase